MDQESNTKAYIQHAQWQKIFKDLYHATSKTSQYME